MTKGKPGPFKITCPKPGCGHTGDLVEFGSAYGGGGCETCGTGAIYTVSMTCPKCGTYDSTDL